MRVTDGRPPKMSGCAAYKRLNHGSLFSSVSKSALDGQDNYGNHHDSIAERLLRDQRDSAVPLPYMWSTPDQVPAPHTVHPQALPEVIPDLGIKRVLPGIIPNQEIK